MRSRRELFVSVGTAVGFAGVASACALGERPSFADDPSEPAVDANGRTITSVAMVGDSITAGSQTSIGFALAAMGVTDLKIDAVSGRRISVGNGNGTPLNGVATTQAMLFGGTVAQVWIIALGTNDINQYAPADYGDVVDQLLAVLPTDVPVVWVDAWRGDFAQASADFNSSMRQQLGQRARAGVVSWVDRVTANPALLTDDAVHPNAEGNVAFADLAVEAVRLAATL